VFYHAAAPHPREIPLISNWPTNELRKRIALERRGNGFGTGIILDRIEWYQIEPKRISLARLPDYRAKLNDGIEKNMVRNLIFFFFGDV